MKTANGVEIVPDLRVYWIGYKEVECGTVQALPHLPENPMVMLTTGKVIETCILYDSAQAAIDGEIARLDEQRAFWTAQKGE